MTLSPYRYFVLRIEENIGELLRPSLVSVSLFLYTRISVCLFVILLRLNDC